MADQPTLLRRCEDYRATKTVLFWACAASAVATIVIGFAWGGWVTGGTSSQRVERSAIDSRAQLAATVCVDRFAKGPDAAAQLVALKGSDSWKRDRFLDDGGWTTLAGMDKPVEGAANLCVQQIMAKASG